jgi:long-subunit fatty acid transport protein
MIIRVQTKLAMVVLVVSLGASTAFGQGIVIPGVGPINRAMAGAAVAAPIDAAGAIHWNPASISFLERSEVSFAAEFTYPRTKLTSALPADAFGPGVPPIPLAGTNRSNSGVGLLPTTAMVYHQQDSDWSVGLGLFTIGGVGVNYHASTTNPILTPQPPAGLGGGAIFSKFTILQFAPTVA